MKILFYSGELRRRAGFTLVEVLTAVSVLAVVMVIFTQIVSMVSETWRKGKARVDNFTQARVALGLMDRDIQSMILRPDVAAFVGQEEDGAGLALPACAFYTRFAGSESGRARRVSLVQYEIADPLTKPRLVRKDYGLDYGSVPDPRTVRFQETEKLPDLGSAVSQEVADGVMAFQYQFVDGNGDLQEKFHFDRREPGALANTRAVTVTLAVIDAESYRLAESMGKLPELVAAFSGNPLPGESYGEHWRRQLPALMASLPPPLRGSIRIFERSIYIPVETVGS